jgi:hypothetical protein
MKKALKPSFEMSDDSALALGNTVVTALTGNTHLPTPQPSLADITAANDAYKTSAGKAKKGSSEDKAQKNVDKAALITLLRDYCDYVNMIAKGDEVILASCGLRLSKERQPSVLGVPNAKVELGDNIGEVILSSPAVGGAVSYKHQYTSDPAVAMWPEISSSSARQKIEGLTPGTVYSFRMVAIGTKGQTTVSETVIKMAA